MCWTHTADRGHYIWRTMCGRLPLHPDEYPCSIGTPHRYALKLLRFQGMAALGRSPHFTLWHMRDAQDYIANVLLGGDRRNRHTVFPLAGQRPCGGTGCVGLDIRRADSPPRPGVADVVARYEDVRRDATLSTRVISSLCWLRACAVTGISKGFAHSVCRNLFIDDCKGCLHGNSRRPGCSRTQGIPSPSPSTPMPASPTGETPKTGSCRPSGSNFPVVRMIPWPST